MSLIDCIMKETTKQSVADFTMTDVEQHIQEGSDWYSGPFCTHRNGYHMCLGVHIYRCDSIFRRFSRDRDPPPDYRIYVSAYLTPGHNDEVLRWPFRGDLYLTFHLDNDDVVKAVICFNARSRPKYGQRPTRTRNLSGEGDSVEVKSGMQFKKDMLISVEQVDVRDCCIHPVYK